MAFDTQKTYDVGILGWWYGKNYGSILTYYGLYKAIESLDLSVLMVHEPLGYNGYRVKWPDDILSMDFARRTGYHYTQQEHYSKLPGLNQQAKTFVVGSDQLWNPKIGRVNDDLFLDFVSDDNRRVAYGTSFGNRGTDKFDGPFIEKHTPNLQKFDAISVREAYAIDTARDIFDVHADLVVDPVFLLPRSHYETLTEQATVKVTGTYMSVFFLDPTPSKRDVAVAIADKLGFDRIVIIPNPDNGRKSVVEIFSDDRFEVLAEDAPENFLNTYKNASYVITDSFHGSAFAAIFGKPFSSIYNTKRGADRFKNLMNSLGFGETRRVFETDTPEKINDNPNVTVEIDFTKAQEYMDVKGQASLAWLKTALKSPQRTSAPTTSPNPSIPTDKPTTNKTSVIGWLKNVLQPVTNTVTGTIEASPNVVMKPRFSSNNDAWRVTTERNSTVIKVAQGGSIRGNLVWCDLPYELTKGKSYRLTLKWTVHTTGNSINLHLRNEQNGKFKVIGAVKVNRRTNVKRTDSIDFILPDANFNQMMLGAIHFSGANAGAEVHSISVEEVEAIAVKIPKPAPGHAEKALEFALSDNDRFVKAHAKSNAERSKIGARARLMFHAHAIEKGLSRSDLRAGFGKIAVPGLAKEMNSWLAAGRDVNDQYFKTGASVMRAYFDRHAALATDVSGFRSLFNAKVLETIEAPDPRDGGAIAAAAIREDVVPAPDRNFLDVVYERRSIREWTDKPVDDLDIQRAVQIAMQAPSVCNRQAARVHVFDKPSIIKSAVQIQGGFSGGYKMPPKLMLVTCDLHAFLFSAERNQPFVDGGLFMMTLLLGLQQVGLGSCSLNTAMSPERENKLRKMLNIPDNEVFIAFVAAGHYDPDVLTPVSKRVHVDDVIVRH